MAQAVTDNSNYKVTIQQGGASGVNNSSGQGVTVVANATANLRLQIENRWVNILEALGLDSISGGFVGKLVSDIAVGAQIVSGANFLPTWATSHVWRGSSGIEITLEMRFDAWTDAQKDVIEPVKSLVKIFSPIAGPLNNAAIGGALAGIGGALGTMLSGFSTSTDNFLRPPGPTPYEYFKNGFKTPAPNTITIHIGNALTITNLIPVNLGWEFENRFVQSGNPVCARISASFISFTLPTQKDILAFFTNRANTISTTTTTSVPTP
jgi:hypothetical protein